MNGGGYLNHSVNNNVSSRIVEENDKVYLNSVSLGSMNQSTSSKTDNNPQKQ